MSELKSAEEILESILGKGTKKEKRMAWEIFLKWLTEWQEEIREEYDKALREAIDDYLNEHADVKTEYGPHGEHIIWFHEEDVVKAINEAKVEEKEDE